MRQISIPCHVCGEDNSIDAFYCSRCQSVIRLRIRSTTTTQLLPESSEFESPEMKLLREAYNVSVLLMGSAHRLRALLDKVDSKD